jgi:UDP-N-acetylglucosamine:LPS N-acetylglucosamine transferase
MRRSFTSPGIGLANWQKKRLRNYQPIKKSRYHAMPYLHEMGAALAAADLVLSRAGASSIGRVSLLWIARRAVPYPYAWRYQKVNADYLAEQNAAVILQDELLDDKLCL